MSDDENQFEQGNAGSSHTYTESAGSLKKGGYVMLKGHPCKITDVSTSKAGKHGHAKASIVGKDIFTNKTYEDSAPTSHNIDVPFVTKKEYTLMDIQGDGFVILMNEDGSTKEDLKLPETEDDFNLVKEIRDQFDAGKDLLISVLSAMGEEKIVGSREAQDK
ncbi:unnamed protein product (macronuclear) [Paramecium tetraurelia]|uniref:Eukaryotic translation initiation factor 5A n=1 Tax=Paramecium tetraurelia TaxID=5888 RepID=A0CS94_PARTE|nr:uncharacterized protein GSPATT00009933001 [Paramecium tetraurelia]XP_001460470.1 uncharacterized protein GSPATT00003942001 [Paramecium tetraurelia]CAK73661.1 unnamed protein product [Paramecium tetraurelia]CAK93073.1 unnamed protein product [Paramecium tetraurelia]|eukprot:XP_001441058.1 hypothetical protein (macronuclear) [Paramecium tetraurelia strain d4-2]